MVEAELALRASEGDLRAFDGLVRRYANAVYSVAYSTLGDFHMAQDIAQEVFLRAYLKLPELKQPGKVGSWLYSIARRMSVDTIRRGRLAAAESGAIDLPHGRIDDDRFEVRQALAALPEDARLPLILFHVAGYTTREVAAFMDLTPEAVEHRLRRARRMLREEPVGVVTDVLAASRLGDEFGDRVRHMVNEGLGIIQETHSALDAGQAPGHEAELGRAARLLGQAYRLGAKSPEVVWPLHHLLTDTGHLLETVALLEDYRRSTEDPLEQFEAGHNIVDSYALLAEAGHPGADALAVALHRQMADCADSCVPPCRVLGSLSDRTMMLSWERTGNGDEWLSRSLALYESLTEISDDARPHVVSYLFTLMCVWDDRGLLDRAVGAAEAALALLAEDDDPDNLFRRADVLGRLIFLHQRQGETAESDAARQRALATARRAEELAADDALTFRWTAWAIYHELGHAHMVNGRAHDAVNLFERSLSHIDDALTRVFYAGVLREAGGAKAEFIDSIRRAAHDPRTSLIHRFDQIVREWPMFEGLRDDPELQAIVGEVTARYAAIAPRPVGSSIEAAW